MTDPLVSQAKALAEAVHDGEQDRLGHAYIWHVADVAARCRHHGAPVETVAWLHDVIESSPPDGRMDMHEMIGLDYGADIQAGVWAMTRLEPPLSPVKEDFHRDYMQRVCANPLARLVKAADLSHNISKLWLMAGDARQSALRDQYARGLDMLDIDPVSVTRPIRFVDGQGWQKGADI